MIPAIKKFLFFVVLIVFASCSGAEMARDELVYHPPLSSRKIDYIRKPNREFGEDEVQTVQLEYNSSRLKHSKDTDYSFDLSYTFSSFANSESNFYGSYSPFIYFGSYSPKHLTDGLKSFNNGGLSYYGLGLTLEYGYEFNLGKLKWRPLQLQYSLSAELGDYSIWREEVSSVEEYAKNITSENPTSVLSFSTELLLNVSDDVALAFFLGVGFGSTESAISNGDEQKTYVVARRTLSLQTRIYTFSLNHQLSGLFFDVDGLFTNRIHNYHDDYFSFELGYNF